MNWKTIILGLSVALIAASQGFAGDDHRERDYDSRERHHEKREGRSDLPQVNNQGYLKECGACHFAYQPGLLPSRSWNSLMNTLDKHFGTDASLDDDTKAKITAYLTDNSAENSPSKRSRKFLNSIPASETPLRISETPYFKDKHREIRASVYKRESIKSPAHCDKCHTSADRGSYSEDFVKIPKK
ncbi:MAG: diheme cytochrome c [Thermodesulfovibrionales bacterium]|jgi:hypothetical protein